MTFTYAKHKLRGELICREGPELLLVVKIDSNLRAYDACWFKKCLIKITKNLHQTPKSVVIIFKRFSFHHHHQIIDTSTSQNSKTEG